MKRWTVRILLCLFLGAVTTVVVAWACASLADHFEHRQPTPDSIDRSFRAVGLLESDYPPEYAFTMKGSGFSITYYGRYGSWEVRENRAGFPFSAMRGHKLTIDETHVIDGLIGRESKPAMIPLRPVPMGLAIDTLFYAAIWFGVFFGFTSAKRIIRIKRGRCPRCGYDLRGQSGVAAGCPECGWNRQEIAA